MLTKLKVEAIQKHLDEAVLSQRAIGRLVGVSRGTVGSMATGRRGGNYRREGPYEKDVPLPIGPLSGEPAQRCGGCGGIVWMPCVLCSARGHKRATKLAKQEGKKWAIENENKNK